MADQAPEPPQGAAPRAPDAERVAKIIARSGRASRRDAERLIAERRVSVNGVVIETPATLATPRDVIAVDGAVIAEAEPPRLFRYNKPRGLVTTARDERGRETIYDHLPPGLPRLMPVGRLDLTSEGLLLLTNDGGLKRRLELPSAGLMRRYRVRVHGAPTDETLRPLVEGVVVDRVAYQPMVIAVDRTIGANAWLTVGITEGKNREIRRAMEAVGLVVNRLIRIGYGPFHLGTLPPGAVDEVRTKALNETLGLKVETPATRERKARRSAVVSRRREGGGERP